LNSFISAITCRQGKILQKYVKEMASGHKTYTLEEKKKTVLKKMNHSKKILHKELSVENKAQ
jgi:hypothetical protein